MKKNSSVKSFGRDKISISSDKNILNISYDEYYESLIPFGFFHKIIFIIVLLILLADGSEALSMSLMLPCIIKEYNITSNIKLTIASIYYFGVLLGALFGGILADKYGRKNLFIFTISSTGVCGFSFFIINGVSIFIFIRLILGIFIGLSSPLTVSLITEFFPAKIRGKSFIFCRIGKMLGEFTAAMLALVYLKSSLNEGNWRILLFWSAIPAFIATYLAFYYLTETPRYLMSKNNYDEAFQAIEKILLINQMDLKFFIQNNLKFLNIFGNNMNVNNESNICEQAKISLNEEEKKNLIYLYEKDVNKVKSSDFKNCHPVNVDYNNFDSRNKSYFNLLAIIKKFFYEKINVLVKGKYRVMTFKIWIMWFCFNFIFYGQTFILPFILSENQSQLQQQIKESKNKSAGFLDSPFMKIIIPILIEIPASFISAILVDRKELGRKNTVALAFLSASVFYFFCYFLSWNILYFITLARFVLVIGYSIKYTFTSEIYHTEIRSTGVGLASAFGRLGLIIMPIILLKICEINNFLPFLVFFIIAIIGYIDVNMMEYDTTNQKLDFLLS